MIRQKLNKLEEKTAPARRVAHIVCNIRRAIKFRADSKKLDYLSELTNYLENYSANIRAAIKNALEQEREELEKTGAIKPFDHFPLTKKEIEAETVRLTEMVQNRIQNSDRKSEIALFKFHSPSTHPEVYRRVINNLI